MTNLNHQILTALDRIGPQAPAKRIATLVTATRHQSRIRRALYEMQCAGLCDGDDELKWTITDAGREVIGGGVEMTKPNCHNRPDYLDAVTVQDGWEDVRMRDINGRIVETRVPVMRTIPNPMSKGCQQHSPHGAATMYGWDCAGCRHFPVSRHPCHTDEPGPCSWGSPSDPACTGCAKRG